MRAIDLIVPAALAVAAAPAVAAPSTWRAYRDQDWRLTVRYPQEWHRAPQSLTPYLTEPDEILTVATIPLARGPRGRCAHMPTDALSRLGLRDALVSVQERGSPQGFPPRPRRFGFPGPRYRSEAGSCVDRPQFVDRFFAFRDARRGFHVLIALGRDATPRTRRTALDILDSLRFDPVAEP